MVNLDRAGGLSVKLSWPIRKGWPILRLTMWYGKLISVLVYLTNFPDNYSHSTKLVHKLVSEGVGICYKIFQK